MTAAPEIETNAPSRFESWLPMLILAWLLVYHFLFYVSVLPNNSPAGQELSRVDVILALPEIFGGLLFPPADNPGAKSNSGFEFLAQRIPIFHSAIFVLAAAMAMGRIVLRRMRVLESLAFAERWAFAGGVGLSFLSLLTLCLGLLGLLSQPLFVGGFTLLITVEATLSWRSRRRRDAESRTRVLFSRSRVAMICLAACLPFVACMLLGAMLPSTDFDVKEYHLQGPKEYFLAGRIHFLPHNVYTSFPFLTEMLSLAGMVVYGDWYFGALVGKTVLMVFAPITALAVYAIARRLTDQPSSGWFAALAYLSTPWAYRISIIAYTEGAMCCYVALALLAWLIFQDRALQPSLEDGSSSTTCGDGLLRWSLLLGLVAGSAASTKYTGILLAAIPFFLAVALRVRQQRLKVILRLLAAYATGVLVAFAPWMLKNLWETGNPVYPFLYSVFGGVDWSEELADKWRRAHSRPSGVFTSLSAFWNDLRTQLDAMAVKNDWQSAALIAFSPLAWLSTRRRQVTQVGLYGLLILAVWYLLTHRIDRFWVPVIPILAALAGCGVAEMLHWAQRQKGRWLPLFVTPLIGGTLVFNFAMVVTPFSGNNTYLMDYAQAWEQTKTRSVALVESLGLPLDSPVLFVGEAQLFDAVFPYQYNTVFDVNLLEEWTARTTGKNQWEVLPAENIRETFQKHGITHVFVNWAEILRYRTTYGYTDYVTPGRLKHLVELGVMVPVSLDERWTLTPFDTLPDSWKRDIESHLPELKVKLGGEEYFVNSQMFRTL